MNRYIYTPTYTLNVSLQDFVKFIQKKQQQQ